MALLFDRIVITTLARQPVSLTIVQFQALPLTDRLRAIFEKRLDFYMGAERVDTMLALQSLRQDGERAGHER